MVKFIWFFFVCLFFRKVLCQDECGGYLVESHGWVTPPDSDNDGLYDNNRDCYWSVLSWNNSAIELNIVFLDLQDHFNCIYDFLAIYDGTDLVGTFCGKYRPPVFLSRHMTMSLHFHSDEEISSRGFNVTYRQVQGWTCGWTEVLIVGSFGSPDLNDDGFYDHDLLCMWFIRTLDSTQLIRLYMTKFDIPLSSNCTEAGLQIYDPELYYGIFCGHNRPPLITSEERAMDIVFYSDCCSVGEGFTAIYLTKEEGHGGIFTEPEGFIDSPDFNKDGNYEPNMNLWWIMVAPDDGIVILQFLSIAMQPHANCEYDYIIGYDGEPTGEHTLGWACGYDLPGLIITKSNILYLQFYSDSDPETVDAGFTAEYWHGKQCGLFITYFDGIFSSFDANGDGYYDHNLDCLWFIKSASTAQKIIIYPAKFDIPASNHCTQDYLKIYDRNQVFGVYCGTKKPPKITTANTVLAVSFHSKCCLIGEGFRMVYIRKAQDLPCWDILVEPTGTIQSIDMDNDGQYDKSSQCRWFIIAPEKVSIELQFLSMALEYHETCDYDYIEIYDYAPTSENFIGWYCGNNLPAPVKSKTNALYILFVSDSDVVDTGFRAEYSFIDPWTCGSTEIRIIGFFTTPDADFDGHYDHHLDCSWNIRSFYSDENTEFYFTRFEVQQSDNCTLDFIKIYDDEQTFGIFCGESRPPFVTTIRPTLSIEFHTDCCINGAGFTAAYTKRTGECGGILLEPRGTIQTVDKNKDGEYDANQNCFWIMVAPDNGTIELTMQAFKIQLIDDMCSGDYFSVYENGTVGEVQVLPRYCGETNEPNKFRSTSNVLTLLFRSDGDIGYSGFVAEFRQITDSSVVSTTDTHVTTTELHESTTESHVTTSKSHITPTEPHITTTESYVSETGRHTRTTRKLPMSTKVTVPRTNKITSQTLEFETSLITTTVQVTDEVRTHTAVTDESITDTKTPATDKETRRATNLPTSNTALASKDMTRATSIVWSSLSTESSTATLAELCHWLILSCILQMLCLLNQLFLF